MKRIAGLIAIATLFIFGTGEANHRQRYSGNTDIFSSSLAPYGEWVNTDFGSAWRPLRVSHHWRPYMNGRWAWTDYGWYWVSDEPFGWATFHYGRWTYDDYYGWIWVPGRDWAPAWVEWRHDDDYIGWAPLSPYAQFSINVGIVWSNHWVAPVHYWNFLSCKRFTTSRVADFVEPVERSRRIFGGTREIAGIRSEHDRISNEGIDTRFLERRGNVRISRADVVDRKAASSDRFIRDNRQSRIEAYRPIIQDLQPGDRTSGSRSGRDQQGDRSPMTPRRAEAERAASGGDGGSRGAVMSERGRERVQSQKDDFHERMDQARRIQEDEQARKQDRRSLNQQPSGSKERMMQEAQRSGNRERVVQGEPRLRESERQRVERGSQQSERERGPARTPQLQGGQKVRGRRPG